MKVNIVTVTYKSVDYISKFLDHFYSHTEKDMFHYTVVDNGSHDATRDILVDEQIKYGFDLVLFNENKGVSWAHNLIWRSYPGEHYIKLDPDMLPRNPYWLSTMLKIVENSANKVGAIGINVEGKEYSKSTLADLPVQIKDQGNLGGACKMIPNYINKLIGYWDVLPNPYGEEDALMGLRVRMLKRLNVYLTSTGDLIPEKDPQYRIFKNDCRKRNLEQNSEYRKRSVYYSRGGSLFIP